MCNTLIVCAPRIHREYQTRYNSAIDLMIDVISANYEVSKTEAYAASYEFTLLDQEPIDVLALEAELYGYHVGVAGDDDTDLATLSRIAAMRAFDETHPVFTRQGWKCLEGEVMICAHVRNPLQVAPGDLATIERSAMRSLNSGLGAFGGVGVARVLVPFREIVVLLPHNCGPAALTWVKSVFRESYDIGVARADVPDTPGDVLLDQAMQNVDAS